MTTYQELRFAKDNNFYNILHPPEKKKTIYSNSINELCFQEIIKNTHVDSFDTEELNNSFDYIHNLYIKEGNFYINGLFKSNTINKILSLSLPENEYILCKFIKNIEFKKIRNESLKIYLLGKQIPNVHRDGFVFYILDTNEYVYQTLEIDWYNIKKLDKKIQNAKDFPEALSICYPIEYRPTFSDSDFSSEKIKIGEKYGEISLLPHCGISFRKKCMKEHIYSTKDKRFNAFLKDTISEKKRKVIQRVRYANLKKNDKWCIISQDLFANHLFQKVEEKIKEEKVIYFDSEYISGDRQYLYGFFHQNGKFDYIWNDSDEEQLTVSILDYLKLYPEYIFIYYNADKKKLEDLIQKYNMSVPSDFFNLFIDMYPLLRDYCAFKNIYNFSMKSIEKVFADKGFITETYTTGNCKNGLDSVFMFEEYKRSKDENIKKDIIEYNRLDCQNQKIILNQLLRMK